MNTLVKSKSSITVRLILQSLTKGVLAGVLAGMIIAETRLSYIACLCLMFMALLRYENPFYLGLSKKMVQESRIIKYGLPVLVFLILLIGSYELLIKYNLI